MRIAAIGCFMLCLTAGSAAAEEVFEPHALLYYQVSFSGSAPDRKASFGVRVDQTRHARNETPDFRQLVARPALAEFRFNSDGVHSLNIAGTDFAQTYRVHRAAEGAAAPEAPAAGTEPAPEEAATADTGSGEAAEAGKEESGDKSLGDYVDAVPAGYLIGIALGVVLLTGLGD